MSDKPKIIKRDEKPVAPELRRLVYSMRAMLRRTYPNPVERQEVAQKIMRQVQAA
jgi:hypothetical protein